MAVSITVASGKGGVGKTSLAINLALTLARTGSRVCLLDTDFGLANAHIMLGLDSDKTISDVVNGTETLRSIRQKASHGLQFISGGSGLNELLNLDNNARYRIIRATDELTKDTDILVVDAPAGASDSTLAFVSAAQKPVIVLVGEPTSFMDAYALIKAAHMENGIDHFSIVVNMANHEAEAHTHFQRFNDIVSRFLDVRLSFAGYLPYSQAIRSAIVKRQPIMTGSLETREALAFQKIANALLKAPANSIKGIGFLGEGGSAK